MGKGCLLPYTARSSRFNYLRCRQRYSSFPGFRPDNEVNESRTNIAGYADFESYLSGQPGSGLLVGAAVRGEQYSDFGATITGKATTRYDLTEQVAFRAAGSTSFRAPLLQQLYFNNISTQLKADNNNADGDADTTELLPFEIGTFRNDSDAARALNIPELKEDTSVNVSGGIVIKPIQSLWLTLDAFQIDIDDRIVLSGSFNADAVPTLAQAGVDQAQVFTNVAQTRTCGIDVATGYLHAFDNESILNVKVAVTWADTAVIGDVEAPRSYFDRFRGNSFSENENALSLRSGNRALALISAPIISSTISLPVVLCATSGVILFKKEVEQVRSDRPIVANGSPISEGYINSTNL